MDTKQLDLLKKLTKLANHNPNDHEANSAARRVCKLLEDSNFILGVAPITPPKAPGPTPNEYYKPQWSPFDRTWDDEIKKANEQTKRKQEAERLRKEYEERHRKYQSNQDSRNHGFYTRSGIRNLKCRKCGTMKETAFVGYADAFICNECWFKIV